MRVGIPDLILAPKRLSYRTCDKAATNANTEQNKKATADGSRPHPGLSIGEPARRLHNGDPHPGLREGHPRPRVATLDQVRRIPDLIEAAFMGVRLRGGLEHSPWGRLAVHRFCTPSQNLLRRPEGPPEGGLGC